MYNLQNKKILSTITPKNVYIEINELHDTIADLEEAYWADDGGNLFLG